MAAPHERLELNVDMRLLPEEEPDIRMPVTSKKRRLSYALVDDEDDESSDDEQQQPAGQSPYEGDYRRRSSLQQQENQEEQFILPPSQDESSASSSESEHEEEEPRDYSMHQHQSSVTHEYADEDELFDAAFVAPEQRLKQQQQKQHAWDKENTHQQGEHYPSLNQPSQHGHYEADTEVVDLCASDQEDTNLDTTGNRSTFLGVRRPEKSPRFNANSRQMFSPNAPPVQRPPPHHTTSMNNNSNENDDDIVDCWSSEDEGNQKPRAARRVTNAQQEQPHQQNRGPTFPPANNVAASRGSFHSNDEDFDRMPAPSRQRTAILNQFKTDRTDRKRRLRDATAGMHSAASVMLRNNNNNSAPFEQASDNLWFRQGQSSGGASTSSSRNDLTGGSGVGAGNYSFTAGQSFQQSFQQPVNPVASGGGGRKRKAAKKPAAKKKGGGKKKKWGGGKRNYYKKGGKKGGSKSSGRGGGKSQRSNRSGGGSNEEYSRKDPLLKNVGGASIIF